MLRAFESVSYLPLLAVRPAEMRALEELPERDKDALLPLLRLGPWATAHRLESTLARIEEAFGRRPYVVDIRQSEPFTGQTRPVHAELDQLREGRGGYANWCSFIDAHSNLIPAVQLANLEELNQQTARLYQLGRGLIVHLRLQTLPFLRGIAESIGAQTEGGAEVCFLIDMGKQNANLLLEQAASVGYLRTVRQHAPRAFVSMSASSFPDYFVDLTCQDIYERQHFDGVRAAAGGERLIYSDRGSARVERQTGGGGQPPPRIDYAEDRTWRFFRAETQSDRSTAYRAQAQRLISTAGVWDERLRLWGAQMIERTARGDLDAITSPARATAARINIHLHRQLHYGDREGLYDTDEDWSD